MANPFKKIFGGLSSAGIFARSGDHALGIDIGSSAIKVVEIKRKGGRAVLETYGAISLGPYEGQEPGKVTNLPIEKLVAALNEVLKQSATTTNIAGLAIPVQQSLIFTVEIPAQVKESEYPAVVSTEARKFIPIPITEVTLDYFVLPKKEESYEEVHAEVAEARGKTDVLVVALQNDAVARYKTLSTEARLSAEFFEIEIFSSVRANFEHELSLTLLLDFGASSTKLTLVEFGTVRAYHTIPRGGADMTESIAKSLGATFGEAEQKKREVGLLGVGRDANIPEILRTHLDYILTDANTVLLNYEKKYGRTVSKVILTGGGAVMKGLKELALENFRVETEVGKPFKKTQAPSFLEKVLLATGPEFATSLGLALRGLGQEV